MEDVVIKSNQNLEGRLWLPENSKKGIIIAHSFRDTFKKPVCIEAAKEFYNKGYAVLAFNFIGHGNSGEIQNLNFRTSAENIASAINYFKQRDIEKIGVYAISLGTIATILSKEVPDAQFLLSPSPLGNPSSLLKRYSKYIDSQSSFIEKNGYAIVTSGSGRGDFKMGKEWINEMRNQNFEIEKIYLQKGVPTLFVQGSEDSPSRIKCIENFVNRTGANYLPIEGADHDFSNPKHRKIVIDKALDFFNKTL